MKRRLLKLIVFVLLFIVGGAIVNVAVAWGFALFHRDVIFTPKRIPLMGMYYWPATGTHWHITYMPEAGSAHFRASLERLARTSEPVSASQLPRWSQFRDGSAPDAGLPSQFLPIWTEPASGWPMYSMYCRVEEDTETGARRVHHGVAFSFGQPVTIVVLGSDAFAPLGILPVGFAIDTLLYAAMLWLGWSGRRALRRRRRIKRGLCPACAYPIGTSDVCTECGKRVKQHA